MVYRATRSFTGRITMIKGEVREISDEILVKDLLRCGYVVPAETKKPKDVEPKVEDESASAVVVEEKKPKAKTAKKGGAKNARTDNT